MARQTGCCLLRLSLRLLRRHLRVDVRGEGRWCRIRFRFWWWVSSPMIRQVAIVALGLSVSGVLAQSAAPRSAPSLQSAAPRPKFDAFEVATIKPVDPDAKAGRYIIMQGSNRFVEKAYTLKLLIAAAYDLNPRTISGGPGWIESDHYDIVAVTPGEVRPTHDEQMAMLRNLLTDRFKLGFHREEKVFSIYELKVAKSGP